MVVILRRTADGGWQVGGALGEPGAAHAQAVSGSFREISEHKASFLCGVAAGAAGLDHEAVREFAS